MEDMEEASLSEALRILLLDTEDVFNADADTQTDPDRQLALSLWQEEIDNYATLAADRKVVERISRAPSRRRRNRNTTATRGEQHAAVYWRRAEDEQPPWQREAPEVDLLGMVLLFVKRWLFAFTDMAAG